MLVSRLSYYLASIPTLLLGIKNWPNMLALFVGLPVSRPFVIKLRNGARFQVRTPMDVWILKEAALERQYERASIEIEDGWTIVDVGAGLGDFSISVARAHPQGTVYAYEPFPESFALLQANLRLNQVDNVKAFPHALGAQSGWMDLHIVSPEAVQHTTAPEHESSDSIRVPSVTLDQVFAEQQLSRCDYVKMDCEGGEYDILFNASDETLQKVQHFCLEYHDGVTEFSHQDLVRFFENKGFQVRLTRNPVHRHLGLLHAANTRLA